MLTESQIERYGYGNERIFYDLENQLMDDIVPRIKNKQTAVRNIRLTSAFFPFTLASETIIEIAVGSPAVDTRYNVVNRL